MFTRRQALLTVSALMASPLTMAAMPEHPDHPGLRAGTELEEIYNQMLDKGFGIRNKASEGKPIVVIVSDTQCPWCSKLWNAASPLVGKVDFRWYPVAVLRDLSLSQGAAILGSKDPWKMMEHHEAHFKDPKIRGLNPSEFSVDQKYRDEVWSNSKIFRKAGGTIVPLGVYKNAEGKYFPILSGTSTEELAKKLGIKL